MALLNVSETLADFAKRFNLDLDALAEETLKDRILREPVSALRARMRKALLSAWQDARADGRKYIGTEHVVLAILLDNASIPRQVTDRIGATNQIVAALREVVIEEDRRS
jgi:ATP-dependent Clp protease ATP-binding subunit ClpA